MKLEKVYEVFGDIQKSLKSLEDNWGNLITEEFEHNNDDAEDRYKHRVAVGLMDKLYDIQNTLERVNSPVDFEGRLSKRSDGRYGISGTEHYFTSGSFIEYWDEEDQDWFEDRIEHFDGDYGLYYSKEQKLEGLLVRIRRVR